MTTFRPVKVKIDYYKTTGKWYAEHIFEMDLEVLTFHNLDCNAVYEKIDGLRKKGEAPGLVKGGGVDFVWVVTVFSGSEVENLSSRIYLPDHLAYSQATINHYERNKTANSVRFDVKSHMCPRCTGPVCCCGVAGR